MLAPRLTHRSLPLSLSPGFTSPTDSSPSFSHLLSYFTEETRKQPDLWTDFRPNKHGGSQPVLGIRGIPPTTGCEMDRHHSASSIRRNERSFPSHQAERMVGGPRGVSKSGSLDWEGFFLRASNEQFWIYRWNLLSGNDFNFDLFKESCKLIINVESKKVYAIDFILSIYKVSSIIIKYIYSKSIKIDNV